MDPKSLKIELEVLDTLSALSDAYARISSQRIKKTRGQVLGSREFLRLLDEVFKEVRGSYRSQVLKLAKKKGDDKITFVPHNGRTVAVFLSANTGLYGALVGKVFQTFLKEVREKNHEVTIVGRLGLELFRQEEPNRPYTYFDFPDYGVDKQNLAKIIRHLVPYEQIRIHFGEYRNLVSQEPKMVDIAAESPIQKSEEPEEKVKYLFEPTLGDILIFFETEMFSSLLEQSIAESQLAKFASRMLAMDQAGVRIRESIHEATLRKLRLTHQMANKKQINSFSSIYLWRK